MHNLLQFMLSGITVGGIYALIATGFTIIYNCTRVVNFSQGEFVMLGAMLAAVLVTAAGLPLPLAAVLAVLLSVAAGVIVSVALMRPLRSGSTLTMIIITIGASIALRGLAMLIWGKDPFTLPSFSSRSSVQFWGASLNVQSLWVLGVVSVMVILLRLFYNRTLIGRAMRACASCPEGASLVGIGINTMTVLSFALGAGVGAVAGIVISPITMAQYDMGAMLGLKGFCAAVMGGLGNFGGGIAAGMVLGIMEAMGAGFISSAYKDAIAFIILLVILFTRPQGIFGGRR